MNDNFFMSLAYKIAEQSSCKRTKIGAVIVREDIVLSMGHNGPPSQIHPCTISGKYQCLKTKLQLSYEAGNPYCRGIHAEQDALLKSCLTGVLIAGSTIYTTMRPCTDCTKMLIASGIREVVWAEDYESPTAINLQKESRVKFRRYYEERKI